MSNVSQNDSKRFCVQKLIKPEPNINTESELFYHGSGVHGFDSLKNVFFAKRGSKLQFDSYFNAFALHDLDLTKNHSISLTIEGQGRCILNVVLARLSRSWDVLASLHCDFGNGSTQTVDLPFPDVSGVIFVEFEALGPIEIQEVSYFVEGEAPTDATITGVITTFKRDAAVQNTAKRLTNYFENNSDIKDRFRLIVVDNGGDTNHVPFPGAQLIKNPNYGGSGGFSRGLLEVVENKLSSHVLFTDDDASFFPETIRRTLSRLLFSNDPKLAIAGALITDNNRSRMWENGAVFNKHCQPLDSGADLRHFGEVLRLSLKMQPYLPNKYGGWWYFCFPVSAVEVWPFPFFVRGDDVNFSLANQFTIKTAIGIVSHSEDFFAKQSPLTVYLDMRSHFVHHLTIDGLKRSWWEDVKQFTHHFMRFNLSYHYESARSVIEALSDIMSDSEFWIQNLDMMEKRKKINGYTKYEKPVKSPAIDYGSVAQRVRVVRPTWLRSRLLTLTANGHLLPNFMLYKRGRFLGLEDRNTLHPIFRRPCVVRYDVEQQLGYVVVKNNKEFFSNMKDFSVKIFKYIRVNSELKRRYSNLYGEFTTEEFWIERRNKYHENNH